jgi:hypothetical protein
MLSKINNFTPQVKNYSKNKQNPSFQAAKLDVKIGDEFITEAFPTMEDVYSNIRQSNTLIEGIKFLQEMAPSIGEKTDKLELSANKDMHNMQLSLNNQYYADIVYSNMESFLQAPITILQQMFKHKANIPSVKYSPIPEKQLAENISTIKSFNTKG